MPSDLPITLDGGRTLLQVGPFQNGVLPVFLLNLQHCVLHPLFSLQIGSFALALVQLGGLIREQVKLFSFRLPGGLAFRNDMVGREVNSAHQQFGVHDAVEKRYHGLDNSYDQNQRRIWAK